MKIVYVHDQIPDKIVKSIFLCGPTPRSSEVISWRKEALEILQSTGYDGVVFIPEDNFDLVKKK